GIGGDDSFHGYATNTFRFRSGQAGELGADVGRRVEQKPAVAVGTDRCGGLGARQGSAGLVTSHGADRAPAVPLREPPTSCCSEKNEAQQESRRARLREPLNSAGFRALQRKR